MFRKYIAMSLLVIFASIIFSSCNKSPIVELPFSSEYVVNDPPNKLFITFSGSGERDGNLTTFTRGEVEFRGNFGNNNIMDRCSFYYSYWNNVPTGSIDIQCQGINQCWFENDFKMFYCQMYDWQGFDSAIFVAKEKTR